jgi:hypothetical protein
MKNLKQGAPQPLSLSLLVSQNAITIGRKTEGKIPGSLVRRKFPFLAIKWSLRHGQVIQASKSERPKQDE